MVAGCLLEASMAGGVVLQMFRNALRIAADEDDDSPQSRTVDLQVGRTVHTVSGTMRTELWLSVLTRNRGAGHAAAREYAEKLARVRSRPWQQLNCRAAIAKRQTVEVDGLVVAISGLRLWTHGQKLSAWHRLQLP